ncbi:unannotated protein [freshwater metagenome]|uniref:Unannotated protein n=1 Tax=freshwater metagenome TaxID=449393 RepID=A0A6J6GNJ4_9ZZZZ
MDNTATRGRWCTSAVRALILASTAATAGVMVVPAENTVSPTRTSSPTARTPSPALGAFNTRTDCVPSSTDRSPSNSVSSTITEQSAPAGMGAPVMMRTAQPDSTITWAPAPAAISPVTLSATGFCVEAPTTSDARTA